MSMYIHHIIHIQLPRFLPNSYKVCIVKNSVGQFCTIHQVFVHPAIISFSPSEVDVIKNDLWVKWLQGKNKLLILHLYGLPYSQYSFSLRHFINLILWEGLSNFVALVWFACCWPENPQFFTLKSYFICTLHEKKLVIYKMMVGCHKGNCAAPILRSSF